jgi:signal transduction histidine kinase/CheY-like chemotaxis protein
VAQAASDDAGGEIEFRVLWPDGSTRWNAGRACLFRGDDGTPARLLGVEMDISDRKQLEAQFRQVQKMEAVGQLAGGIAHDFNNVLTAILGYAALVIDTFDQRDERRADLEEVVKAGHRAAALTSQLLAFSRKQVLQPAAVDLNALVTGMGAMLRRLIGEHINLVTIFAPDLAAARADSGQLEQVLMNLVVNARDAMPSGGRLAVETANVDLDQSFVRDVAIVPGPYVMLAVSDSGVGMDEATKQRLFEPFFTTKEQGKGTGLGLATVYGIVKQSHGHIWVYSEPGHGASFKLYLPRADHADAAVVDIVSDTAVVAGTETVLIVEDDEAVRSLERTILQRAGYRVFDAASPADCERLFGERRNQFELLVTDVIMPGCTGPALFERLARQHGGLQVLYVSGYTDDSIVRQGELGRGITFLQKPFTAPALKQRIRDILDRRPEVTVSDTAPAPALYRSVPNPSRITRRSR